MIGGYAAVHGISIQVEVPRTVETVGTGNGRKYRIFLYLSINAGELLLWREMGLHYTQTAVWFSGTSRW